MHAVFQEYHSIQATPHFQDPPFQSTFLAMPFGNETFETGDSFNLDNFEISAEVLDAFSFLEPIDATVGALRDLDSH
jgi:hypothetical protein